MYAVITDATSRKSVESSTLSGQITSDAPAPLVIQAVRDLVRARGKEMQAEDLNAHVAAQVCVDLMRGPPCFGVDVGGSWCAGIGLEH